MLPTLALVLPLLASVDALGGDHYVAHRSRVLKRDGNQRFPVLKRHAEPIGGDHYAQHRTKVGGGLPVLKDRAPSPAGGDHYAPHRNKVAGGLPVLKDRNNIEYDERGLPITATTTVVVPMTETVTVWVDAPTGSADPSAPTSVATNGTEATTTMTPTVSMNSNIVLPSAFEPSSSGTDASGTPSGSPSPSPSAESSSSSSSSVASPSPSTDATASPSVTDSPSSSESGWSSTTASPSWSDSISVTYTSSGSSHTSYLSETASPTATESPAESSSSHHHGHSSSSSASETSGSPTQTDDDTSASPTSTGNDASASPSSSTSQSPSPTGSLNKRLMNGYWADWEADTLPPEKIDWERFDVINYAFAEPAYDGTLEFTQSNSAALLTRLTKAAHAAGKRVVLSVGGWTGSAHFSSIVATATRRTDFVQKIVKAIDQYSLDGIDLDWEYPGAEGAGGNTVSPSDSDNYLIFLKELRAAVPQGSLITAATQVWPFYGNDGQPMKDVSGFAEIFDWILLMNYDIWGASSKPGPNAPLNDGCKNSEQPTANAYAAVASWVAAGMPADKITLGVAAYGYVQKSTSDKLYNRRWNMPYPPNRKRASSVTIKNGDGGTADGQVTFRGLVDQGALTLSGGAYTGAGGFTRHWDECSSTPWLKSSSAGQIVTYDDPQSLNMKGQFALQAGLRGCSMWSLDGDYNDGSDWPLTSAVRSGMGL